MAVARRSLRDLGQIDVRLIRCTIDAARARFTIISLAAALHVYRFRLDIYVNCSCFIVLRSGVQANIDRKLD